MKNIESKARADRGGSWGAQTKGCCVAFRGGSILADGLVVVGFRVLRRKKM